MIFRQNILINLLFETNFNKHESIGAIFLSHTQLVKSYLLHLYFLPNMSVVCVWVLVAATPFHAHPKNNHDECDWSR